jgi:hypothetical protein
MHFPPLLIPLVFFAIGVMVMISRVLGFMRKARFSVSTSPLGKTVRVESSLGSFDLKPHPDSDPALAAIPLFPGATGATIPAQQYEADINFGGKVRRYIGTTFITEASAAAVLQFYRNALPDWQPDAHRDTGDKLTHAIPGGELAVEIRRKGNKTFIQHGVSYTNDIPETATTFSPSVNATAASAPSGSTIYRKEDPGTMPGVDNRFGTGEITPR